MHEDPTRMMRQPDGHKPQGNMRLLVAGLIAVIVGLVIAIAVIASDDGDGGATSNVTTLPTETTESTADETTTGSTTETTTPTTTETTAPTTTETTTTTTSPPPEEEGSGSGGIGAP